MYRLIPLRMIIADVKNKLIAYVNTGIRPCPNRYTQEDG